MEPLIYGYVAAVVAILSAIYFWSIQRVGRIDFSVNDYIRTITFNVAVTLGILFILENQRNILTSFEKSNIFPGSLAVK